ncbi:DUF4139 domain-containing protein [Oleiagrimonas sp. C23AA]|uniref:DUF4139 domain-containing protein n=1 Tax=Oleiagrimonas sp. C23AA TaxID=2719047 RepID=UPI0014200270|nr:DUF4139 domain-containing protein [Oleiagrimonas sp. C23AA]NII09147.1 DUF4139 domain-containing protein [Oleiagrimonas sp. C23AA]
MRRTLLALALASLTAAPALAADGPSLTLYHTGNDQLFQGNAASVDAGYAVVHEMRTLHLNSGTQDVVVGNLPDYLDPEAVALSFPSDRKTQVLSQRLLLSQGHNGTLTGHIGKQVTVLGNNGQNLVQGTLVAVGADGSLTIGGDVFGPTVVRNYGAIKLTGGQVGGGSRLQLRVKSHDSDDVDANLTYPTAGLAWRASYAAMLQPGHSCRVQLKAQASIANRSGRSWKDVALKLVAGKPSFATESNAPRPMMMMAKSASTPQQSTLDDYRSFTLDGRIDLPNGSVTLTPLYDTHTFDCDRSWVYETGRQWQPSQPMLSENFTNGSDNGSISSELRLRAFDTFPAGVMRVWTRDKDGHAEFLGQGPVDDTPKGRMIALTLGQSFDLKGQRQRTSFHLSRAARTLDEAFRVTLSNAGDVKRTVMVIEHPSRWNHWTLTSSSQSPAQQNDNTLSFKVDVPAKGKATLDYALRYSWSPGDD